MRATELKIVGEREREGERVRERERWRERERDQQGFSVGCVRQN